jgi:hypothetical protein
MRASTRRESTPDPVARTPAIRGPFRRDPMTTELAPDFQLPALLTARVLVYPYELTERDWRRHSRS